MCMYCSPPPQSAAEFAHETCHSSMRLWRRMTTIYTYIVVRGCVLILLFMCINSTTMIRLMRELSSRLWRIHVCTHAPHAGADVC